MDWTRKGAIDFVHELSSYTFSVVTEAAIGIRFPFAGHSRTDMLELFQIYVRGITSLWVNLPFTKFGKALKARQKLRDIVQEGIGQMREDPQTGGALSAMRSARDENGDAFTIDEIKDNVLTIAFAGYDTTISSLSTALLVLGQHPEAWRKIVEEQARIVAEFGPEFTAKSVAAMTYTEAVFKEVNRMLPPGAATPKIAARTFELGGRRIPKDWMVMGCMTTPASFQDDSWPLHCEFQPERFLARDSLAAESSIVFGVGPHMCIGRHLAAMQTKILLAVLARGYDVKVMDTDPGMHYIPLAGPNELPLLVNKRDEGFSNC
ncbi:unnamed protein product [Ostreobium quekettii]|uniref:Cytochrome P450 n=1 Tax=Ostreobium quekettii TaxID=121088 RepID=A0A8S1IL40_9CHLO|nr:unnamed protein product [Ostreobium quekettii]